MRDEKRWRLATSQVLALRDNMPMYLDAGFVEEYHAIVELFKSSSGEDFSLFRIPDREMKPRVISFRMGSRRHPGSASYSREKYCDVEFSTARSTRSYVISKPAHLPLPPQPPPAVLRITHQ
jgi:hypothetical protein